MARSPKALKAKLDAICARFRGVMGYSLYHTRLNHRIDHRGDEIFPTASTIKVAVMAKAMEEIDSGRLSYTEKLPITPDDIRDGSGLLQFFKENQSVEVRMLLHLMITVSDNTATIMLARRLGTVEVNRYLERLGLRHTKVYTKDAEDTRWTPDNEGEVAICEAARTVWRFYHPRDPWRPPKGAEKFSSGYGGA
ncbi:MAG: class A beta-lactamase-related serine hydrolase [Fimbriimonadales bacterium]|nr:class A beta-lactamase-related serine hydrolase [Fimbriimonadales bacterium]MDW8051109.1 serine hydrolase [Armatimonadota bacterium]